MLLKNIGLLAFGALVSFALVAMLFGIAQGQVSTGTTNGTYDAATNTNINTGTGANATGTGGVMGGTGASDTGVTGGGGTPGLPETGVGGSALLNMLLLLGSLGLVSGGLIHLRRNLA